MPRSPRGALTSLRTRQVQGRTLGHPARLGGSIVVVPGGAIVWSHIARDASDNASPKEVLTALRRAG